MQRLRHVQIDCTQFYATFSHAKFWTMKYRILLLLLFPAIAFSQDMLLKADYFYDSENGKFLQDIEVHVKGNKIAAVGKDLKVDLTKTTVKDLGNVTLLPGLIDAHTHLFIEEELHATYYGFGEAVVKNLVNKSETRRALEAANRAESYLKAGFTSVRDLGNSGIYQDVDLRDAIKEKLVTGPRMFVSGPGIAAIGGQLNKMNIKYQHLEEEEYEIVTGAQEAIEAIRRHVLMKVDVIKVYADNIPNRTMLSVEELQELTKEAKRFGKRVTAHAITNQAVWNAAQANVDCIEHAYVMADSTLALIKKKGIYLVPTYSSRNVSDQLYTKYGITDTLRRKKILDRSQKRQSTQLFRLYDSGAPIAFGSDFYSKTSFTRGEAAKQGIVAWLEAEVPIETLLQYATINAAKLIGEKVKLGVVKKGYYADIIAVSGNLEKDPKAIEQCVFVMKNGKIVRLD